MRGRLRIIVGTDPAAGAEMSEVVPANKRWLLLYLRIFFQASAVAGNRAPSFQVDDGAGNIPLSMQNPLVIAASASAVLVLSPGGTETGPTTLANLIYSAPVRIELGAGMKLKTATGGLDAGDNYNAPVYQVEEWDV